jgi:hypothetical protein
MFNTCPPKRFIVIQPGDSAIKATLDLVHPPFRLILRSIMSDARLRRANKKITSAPDGQFFCRFYVLARSQE